MAPYTAYCRQYGVFGAIRLNPTPRLITGGWNPDAGRLYVEYLTNDNARAPYDTEIRIPGMRSMRHRWVGGFSWNGRETHPV